MMINGINSTTIQAGQAGMKQASDSYSRNIQNQIATAQKQLQELSADSDMPLEEKMKKRQEIQQQIRDLNMQLRQHQTEQRREKQQKQDSPFDHLAGTTGGGRTGQDGIGISQEGMTALISAGSSMKQAKVQGRVASGMEGRAGTLAVEIKLDSARGGDTQAKEKELADIEQSAMKAAASQIDTLSEANRTLQEASDADRKDSGEEETKAEEKTDAAGEQEQTTASQTAEAAPAAQQSAYKPVDIRL